MSGGLEPALREEFLRHPFLVPLERDFVESLIPFAEQAEYGTGAVIARQGDPATDLFLLVAGKVGLELVPHDRPALTILTLGPGEVFGWSWLVPPHRWRIDARALKPTRVFRIDGGALRTAMEARPRDGYRFLRELVPVLAQRLDATRLQLLDVHAP